MRSNRAIMAAAVVTVVAVTGCAVTADPQRAFDQAATAERRLGLAGERALDALALAGASVAPVTSAARGALEGAQAIEREFLADMSPSRQRTVAVDFAAGIVIFAILLHLALEAARLRRLLGRVHEDVQSHLAASERKK